MEAKFSSKSLTNRAFDIMYSRTSYTPSDKQASFRFSLGPGKAR